VNLALWRDISIVWLSLFCFIGLAIPLVALYFMVRGINRVPAKFLSLLRRAQGYSRTMQRQSELMSYKISDPIIQVKKRATRLRTALRKAWTD
jgi:hypothetical protein